MKYIQSILLLPLMICMLTLAGCSEKTPPPPPVPDEENLAIALDPDPGTSTVRALGTTYDIKVIIQSAMPSGGVEIETVYRRDADNSELFSQKIQSNAAQNNITISNIPFNDPGTVTITVTSRSKPANKAVKTFKLVRK